MKVSVTYDIKVGEGDTEKSMNEVISPSWTGRWLELGRDGPHAIVIELTLDRLDRIEESYKHPRSSADQRAVSLEKTALIAALGKSILDDVWSSDDLSYVREELETFVTTLDIPIELEDIAKLYVAKGPHYVNAEKWKLHLLADLAYPLSDTREEKCEYEAQVMCGSLKGSVE